MSQMFAYRIQSFGGPDVFVREKIDARRQPVTKY